MKKVVFQGGLGNQLFQYAFYKYVVKHIDDKAVAVLRKGNNHGGFQLYDYFDVEINFMSGIQLAYYRIREFLDLKGIIKFKYANENNFLQSESDYIADYFQSSLYIYPDFVHFIPLDLDEKNKEILNRIQTTNSVSIHIRRGDYIIPKYQEIYGNICTLEYYEKAIDICRQHYKELCFFIFSDDIEWSKNNLPLEDATYVDWNQEEKSPIDMFLMSNCKINIIANSTFSYWGAYLNRNDNMVVYPHKWFNSKYETPKIFPEEWIGL